jgi:hypothetical protein
MSFEGYYQILCGNGHLSDDDVYYCRQEEDYWKCTVCGEREAWRNLVDVTNGSYYENERIDGFVELEVDHKPVSNTCDMGHQHLVSPVTYKIPATKGKTSMPDRQLTTAYLKVKLVIKHPAHVDPDEALQRVVSECDYEFDYNDLEVNGISIESTEILDSELEEE